MTVLSVLLFLLKLNTQKSIVQKRKSHLNRLCIIARCRSIFAVRIGAIAVNTVAQLVVNDFCCWATAIVHIHKCNMYHSSWCEQPEYKFIFDLFIWTFFLASIWYFWMWTGQVNNLNKLQRDGVSIDGEMLTSSDLKLSTMTMWLIVFGLDSSRLHRTESGREFHLIEIDDAFYMPNWFWRSCITYHRGILMWKAKCRAQFPHELTINATKHNGRVTDTVQKEHEHILYLILNGDPLLWVTFYTFYESSMFICLHFFYLIWSFSLQE